MSDPLALTLPAAALEAIAKRAAELAVEQLRAEQLRTWMDRPQAAAYLGLPVSRLEKDRTIPCHRDNGRVLYYRAELDAHMLSLGR